MKRNWTTPRKQLLEIAIDLVVNRGYTAARSCSNARKNRRPPMFDDIDVVCRAAACLTHADGRKRFVYQNGNGPTVTTERPCHPHTEMWRSSEIHTLIMGTSIRPCPALHPSALYGIVFQEGDRRWVRDWHGKDHLVFLRAAEATGLIALPDETPAFMPGGDIVCLSAGFVVQVTQLFQVGADLFSLLEDGDGNEFLVWGRI